jgi:hypothetical protein
VVAVSFSGHLLKIFELPGIVFRRVAALIRPENPDRLSLFMKPSILYPRRVLRELS